MRTELESGWFAIKKEPDDKDDYGKKQLTKVSVQEADYSIGYTFWLISGGIIISGHVKT